MLKALNIKYSTSHRIRQIRPEDHGNDEEKDGEYAADANSDCDATLLLFLLRRLAVLLVICLRFARHAHDKEEDDGEEEHGEYAAVQTRICVHRHERHINSGQRRARCAECGHYRRSRRHVSSDKYRYEETHRKGVERCDQQ